MSERVKLSGREYAQIQIMFAALSALQETEKCLAKRCEIAGIGDRLPSIIKEYESVLIDLLKTVPETKLAHLRKELDNTKIYVKVEPPGGAQTMSRETWSYVKTKALNHLISCCIDYNCLLCDKTKAEAKKCPHMAAIQGCLPHAIGVDHKDSCPLAGAALELDTSVDLYGGDDL